MRQDILEGIRRHIQPLAGVEHRAMPNWALTSSHVP